MPSEISLPLSVIGLSRNCDSSFSSLKTRAQGCLLLHKVDLDDSMLQVPDETFINLNLDCCSECLLFRGALTLMCCIDSIFS